MSEDGDDVRRALTIVFRGADGLARPDVERAFSFDMEWVAPHEAEEVVNALVSAGWLEERKQKLHLALDLGEVNVPFGWFPRPTRLMRPVSANSGPGGTFNHRNQRGRSDPLDSRHTDRSKPGPG